MLPSSSITTWSVCGPDIASSFDEFSSASAAAHDEAVMQGAPRARARPSDVNAATPAEAVMVKDGTLGGTWPELTALAGTSIAIVSGAEMS